MLAKIPGLFKNFFFIFGVSFVIWMLFFDANDFISEFRINAKQNDLEDEKAYYLDKINEVKNDRQALLSNPQQLEKFARETYRMKKKTEDVYVVIEH